MIKLENICYSVHDHPILKNISLEIPAGKIFTIIGASGAGKSTLLRCLNLLAKPTQGKVFFENREISRLKEHALRTTRKQMGMIFQQFNLLDSQTAFDNIALPLRLAKKSPAEIEKRACELLALVDLSDKAKHYPHQLSGGQKQRIAIARALALAPKVLLCDEPTSALDPESAKLILDLLKKINQELQITIVLISHQMEVIKTIADIVAVIDKGQIVEIATVIDIFTQPKTAISKKLTQQNLHLVLPDYLQQRIQQNGQNKHPIVKLTFIGKSAQQSLLSTLTKLFNISTNILLADIEMIHENTLGFTICELEGEQQQIEQALNYTREQGIMVEVLGYVA